MGYEIYFESYKRVSDANDLPAAERAFAALSEATNRTLILPNREIIIGTVGAGGVVTPGVLTLQGLNRAELRGEGGTIFKNAQLIFSGCYDCESKFQVLATGPIGGAAITIETAIGQPTGQNAWNRIRVEGQFERAIHFKDSGSVGNNDFNTWDTLTVHGVSEEAVLIDSAMSVGHKFLNPYFTSGKYGIRSKGGFDVDGGRMSLHSIADFCQWTTNSVPDTIAVRKVVSENSARLFTNYGPASNGTIEGTTQISGIPVSFRECRFACEDAVVDASDSPEGNDFQLGVLPTENRIGIAIPINAGFRGPYVVENCHFYNGLSPSHVNGVRRIRLRLAGGGPAPDKGGRVSGCTFATDNINAPLIDRGRAENNLAYIYTTDGWAWFPDHIP